MAHSSERRAFELTEAGPVLLSSDRDAGPSVIVADIALPDEDGYAFIRRVRAHSRLAIQSVPAIAVTAYASILDREEALAVGFHQHLPKPIDPARLVQAIYDLTRRLG